MPPRTSSDGRGVRLESASAKIRRPWTAATHGIALLARLIDHAPTFPPASLPLGRGARRGRARRREPARVRARSVRLAGVAARRARRRRARRQRRARRAAPRGRRDRGRRGAVSRRPRRRCDALAAEVYVEVPVDDALEQRLDALADARSAREGAMRRSDAFRATRSSRGFVRGCRERGLVVQGDRRAPSRRARRTASTASSTCSPRWSSGTRRRRSPRPTRPRSRSTPTRSRGAAASVGAAELARGRRELFHSIGSCSFFEPVEELEALGMLPLMTGGVGFGVFSVGGDAPRVGFRVGHDVLDLAAHGLGAVFDAPTPEPVPRARPLVVGGHDRAHRRARRARRRSRPARADADVGLPFDGRRLRRLLLVARARDEPRTPLPAGRRAAAAELAPPAGRLPRPRRDGRRQRDADRAARAARRRRRATTRRASARAGGSTSSSSSASSSESAAVSASRCARRRSATTSSASCSSTTGARATSRPGSTSRSARSSASRSRRRSPPG